MNTKALVPVCLSGAKWQVVCTGGLGEKSCWQGMSRVIKSPWQTIWPMPICKPLSLW